MWVPNAFLLFVSSSHFLLQEITGHGMITSPRSRNWVAAEDGLDWGRKPGVPKKDYDSPSLNTNTGVCGRGPSINYDDWLDTTGAPMSWASQAVYSDGTAITVGFSITAFHWGHVELKACPAGRASDQACFDEHPLTFVRDLSKTNMPSDPRYPERGYVGPKKPTYQMEFLLPSGLSGNNVLLQWKYITANSCNPSDYALYFSGHNSQGREILSEHWRPSLGDCPFPYSTDGTGVPEQFWNCVEVSVVSGSGNPPTNAPPPTPLPTSAPTTPPTPSPNVAPTAMPTTEPRASTTDPTLVPVADTLAPVIKTPSPVIETPAPVVAYSPVVPPTGESTSTPVDSPVGFPTASPADSNEPGCCSLDFKNCISWCGDTAATCGNCNPYQSFHWVENGGGGGNSQCKSRWLGCHREEGDTNLQGDCCSGLQCVGTQWWKQCTAP